MKNILDFILELSRLDIKIHLDGEKLKINSPEGILTDEILNKIKVYKPGIIKYLSDNNNQVKSIEKATEAEGYALSFAQKRLWFLSQNESANQAYNLSGAYIFKGELNEEALQFAFDKVIARHEILRTIFKENNGEALQQVLDIKDFKFKIATIDLRADNNSGDTVKVLLKKHSETLFDHARGPLIKATLIRIEDDKYVLICTLHHIISDAWSLAIFVRDLMLFYSSFSSKIKSLLTPLEIQHKDYTTWLESQMKNSDFKKHKQYWLKQLSGQLPVLDLKGDNPRPAVKSYKGGVISGKIKDKLARDIKNYSYQNGTTLFICLVSAVKSFLHKYTAQTDLLIGTPIAGRENAILHDQIGLFMNTLALRTYINPEYSFDEIIKEVKRTTLEAYEHQIYPFDELAGELNINRDMGRSGIFDVLVAMQDTEIVSKQNLPSLDGLEISSYDEIANYSSKFDLSFSFVTKGEEIHIDIEYNSDILLRASAERIYSHFEYFLYLLVKDHTKPLATLSLLTENEEEKILNEFNHDSIILPHKTIVEIFEEQVKKNALSPAIEFNETILTYTDLNERSNQFADYLRKKYKISKGKFVGVSLTRSDWTVVALLGILKSKGVYVPIDPNYPEDRINYIINDTACSVLINDSELEEFIKGRHEYSKSNSLKKPSLSDLAYIIYTSGSTGEPKGVLVEHKSIASFCESCNEKFSTSFPIHIPALASFAFDISLFEIFIALLTGGKLIVLEEEQIKNIISLSEKLKTLNAFHAVPALMSQIVNYIKQSQSEKAYDKIKNIFIGGDSVPTQVLEQLQAVFKQADIHVLYGPTESTVFVTSNTYSFQNNKGLKGSLIGKPNRNARVIILDKSGNLVPIGVVGEICISGPGVSNGYLNKNEATETKFVKTSIIKEGKIYKTGDLGRWMQDGNIEFIGRNDSQVKIRGYRIEPGEIETVVSKIKGIKQAVVLAKKDQENLNYLTAYIEPEQKIKFTPSLAEYFVYDEMAYNAMTTDEKRNVYYKKAFSKVLKDKVVLDIGTGPDAILAQLCIEAGAKKVYAVELLAQTFENAKNKVLSLGLDNKIDVIHGDITKIELPEKVDYCVSEIVGSIGGSEGAAVIINNSKRFLNNDANVIPARSLTKIAAVSLPDELHKYEMDEISNHYMNKIFEQVGYQFDVRMCVENLPAESIISEHQPFEDLNFTTTIQLETEHIITLKINKESLVTGFVVWLNLFLNEEEVISTLKEKYIWLPVYIPAFDTALKVTSGDLFKLNIKRELSENGLNPDFIISGTLLRLNAEPVDFTCYSSNHKKLFRSNMFYNKLFDNLNKPSEILNAELIRKELKNFLPEYMIPSEIHILKNFPLTINNKIDVKTLEKYQGKMRVKNKNVILDESEQKLANIWKSILDKEIVELNDDFFELGGHSLKASRLVSQIHRDFDVKIELKQLFENSTFESQSKLIKQAGKSAYEKIPLAQEKNEYPLSSAQRRLWILSQFEGGNKAYNMPGDYTFEGDFNLDAFIYAFDRLLERHEILRTIFRENKEHGVSQIVLTREELGFRVNYSDLRKIQFKDETVKRIVREDIDRAFDLEKGPVLRATLLRVEDQKYVFTYVMHHIISDGWSMEIIIDELLIYYNSYIEQKDPDVQPLRIQYKDFAVWQNEELKTDQLNTHKDYWIKRFEKPLPILNLALDKPRPNIKTYNGGKYTTLISRENCNAFKKLNQNNGTTLFMGLVAVVNSLLYRYSGQTDIVLGSPMAGRNHWDLEDQIGIYANTLALRTRFSENESFHELLIKVKEVVLGAHQHQVYPFDELVDALRLPKDMSRNPLFDVQVILQNTGINSGKMKSSLGNLKIGRYKEADHQITSRFDLAFNFVEKEEGLFLTVEYNEDIFFADTIVQFCEHLKHIIYEVNRSPLVCINNIDLLSIDEKEHLINTLNKNTVIPHENLNVLEIFKKNVIQFPNRVAVNYKGNAITFSELDEKSDSLAAHLINNYHISAGDSVGLAIDRSDKAVLVILSILKSAAAFIPIDLSYPKDRKAYMIRESKVKLIITQIEHVFDLDFFDGSVFAVDTDFISEKVQDVNIKMDDTAYVIFTSGTTGYPKGVSISHEGIANTVRSVISNFGIKSEMRHLQFASLSFDASVFEILISLCSGGSLFIIDELIKKDVPSFESFISENAIEVATLTPSFLKLINPNQVTSIRILISAGEAADIKSMNLFSKFATCFNAYGPTETSICATYYKVNEGLTDRNALPIGLPLANVNVYVLDHYLNLLPLGAIGEICIGGKGVAKKYLNQNELTIEKFIVDEVVLNDRIYRTGDLGRWLKDGNLEYIGRVDSQVKLNGYRIELSEIENTILKCGAEQVCVIKRNISQDVSDLLAYVIHNEDNDVIKIKESVSKLLPDYMIPAHFIRISTFPMTTNGKVDKAQLIHSNQLSHRKTEYIAPKNETEKNLILVIAALLKLDINEVGVLDNFFDLGANSIMLMHLNKELSNRFNYDIKISDLFQFSDVKSLCGFLDNRKENTNDLLPGNLYTQILPAPKSDFYPLTSTQKRFWFLSQFKSADVVYSIPGVFSLEGAINIDAFEAAINTMIQRHEILRTVFKTGLNGEPFQFILDPADAKVILKVETFDEHNEKTVAEILRPYITQGFDLSNFLIRTRLVRLNENHHIFIFVIHHIICDGWSLNLLVKELMAIYRAYSSEEKCPLEPLKLQFKDYAYWQNEAKEKFTESKNYWLRQLAGELPVTEFPTDKIRPALKTYNGNIIRVPIDQALVNQLKDFTLANNCTMFIGLVSVVKALLCRHTDSSDFIIGTPITGREHPDLLEQIGPYLNTIVIRTKFTSDDSFTQVLEKVKVSSLGAFEHKSYPFDELVGSLNVNRDPSRNAIFDIIVTLQNGEINSYSDERKSQLLTIHGYDFLEEHKSKFDMAFDFTEVNGGLSLSFEYNTDLYNLETASGIIEYFIKFANLLTQFPLKPIFELDYLTDTDKEKIRINSGLQEMLDEHQPTFIDLFLEKTNIYKDKPAVVDSYKILTYYQLNEESLKLANLIQKSGCKKGSIIPICIERSSMLISSVIAILRSGCVYVPLDPEHPKDRLSYIINDIQSPLLIVDNYTASKFEDVHGCTVINISNSELDECITEKQNFKLQPDDEAYIIYTSGSTGKPKGVVITHSNLSNFLIGMNNSLGAESKNHILAITSVAFDISILELLWPLTRGMTVTLNTKNELVNYDKFLKNSRVEVDFSLFFFSSYDFGNDDKYELLLESSKYADENGFSAVWIPERHFHEFGGIFPNPSILAASLASVTNSISIRAGSIVLPLHDVIRVAEEWSVVDNLSHGRVGMSIASGWHSNDFVLKPGNYDERKTIMFRQLDELKILWEGNRITRKNGNGQNIELRIFPKPIQNKLPVWITSGGNIETFIEAGKVGAKVLTHMLGQDIEALRRNIDAYRISLIESGYSDEDYGVSLMLHTFIGNDLESVRKETIEPFKEYLRSNLSLIKNLAESFNIKIENISEGDMNILLDLAFERYWQTAALLGTVDSCKKTVERLIDIGVTEIACLIDFGIENATVLGALNELKKLTKVFAKKTKPTTVLSKIDTLQITPSYLNALLQDNRSRSFLKSLEQIIVGGEKMPPELISRISEVSDASIYNMYGPTETTIWSTYTKVDKKTRLSIGRPILNTYIYILDKNKKSCPIGVVGELYIGGKGVAKGYLNNPSLTDAAFLKDPNFEDTGLRIYKTGDYARWLPDGNIEFKGRKDNQIKIRGYRIELGEIEKNIEQNENVISAAVIFKEFNSETSQIIAFFTGKYKNIDVVNLQQHLGDLLPRYMLPDRFIQIESMPLTQNGKLDKTALLKLNLDEFMQEVIAPRTEMELAVHNVWKEILGKDDFGVKENFFSLGAHSLTVIILLSQMRESLGIDLTVEAIFSNPTIELQAKELARVKWRMNGEQQVLENTITINI